MINSLLYISYLIYRVYFSVLNFFKIEFYHLFFVNKLTFLLINIISIIGIYVIMLSIFKIITSFGKAKIEIKKV